MTASPSKRQESAASHLLDPRWRQDTPVDTISSSPVHLSQASSQIDFPLDPSSPHPPSTTRTPQTYTSLEHSQEESLEQFDLDDWVDDDDPAATMPSDLRPDYSRPNDGKSQTRTPLLNKNDADGYMTSPPLRPHGLHERRKSRTFKAQDPEETARAATRKRYTYAGFFLILSLISFCIQTETAVYIKKYAHWNKSYAMLYVTHGSWTILWFAQLLILRIQKWDMPWQAFWRRHAQILSQTAQMVQHQDIHAPSRYPTSPWPSYIRTVSLITMALTVAGGSWYVAVSMTTASDLTAIYNCSAFFAYAFSVPLLKEKLRWSKVAAVCVAIVGVLIVAYGDTGKNTVPKHGSHSGGGTGGAPHPDEPEGEPDNRALGNLVIGVGSVLYGLYEVLYKRYLCPPEETSPGRSMIFANFVGTSLGAFTLLVLWIPLPILHYLDIETFELPPQEAVGWLLLSVTCNATFSGSFLIMMSLTSPVLSSVAALLTIFLVALVDELLPKPLHNDLSRAAWIGGLLIIVAFLVLSWATYKEMDEERRKKGSDVPVDESDLEDEDP